MGDSELPQVQPARLLHGHGFLLYSLLRSNFQIVNAIHETECLTNIQCSYPSVFSSVQKAGQVQDSQTVTMYITCSYKVWSELGLVLILWLFSVHFQLCIIYLQMRSPDTVRVDPVSRMKCTADCIHYSSGIQDVPICLQVCYIMWQVFFWQNC